MTPPPPSRERVMLGLLHSVEQDATQSQRGMASEFGVALGLINTCLRYCVRKGYVKVKRIPARRYAYFLTPKGLAEKSRLTVAHLSYSLSFFRQAREDCSQLLETARGRGWHRFALVGASELADITFLCAAAAGVELVGVLDAAYGKEQFRELPVVKAPSELAAHDALILTDMTAPQAVYDRLAAEVDPGRILPLNVLHISAAPNRAGG